MSERAEMTGFTTSIKEYTRVEGIILRPAEAIVKYGTLVLIKDNTQGKEYLAMITNVHEETPHPALDVERLRKLYQTITEASLQDAYRVLQELLSPTQNLIKWSSIMSVELRVLGEIKSTGRGERLDTYERPPRPFSSISEPEPGRLERIIHSSLGPDYKRTGIYIGRLSLLETVRIYMNASRLNTHLSILAQTGGGKTETVKRLVYEITRRRHHIGKPLGGVVVFDIAGEYTGYPYIPPDSVPLLDAVLNPRDYEGTEHIPDPVYTPEAVTVVVPYELTRTGGREQEKLLLEGLRSLACQLSARLGRAVDVLAFLTWERRYARVDASNGGRCDLSGDRRLRYDEAYNILLSSPFLVVGLPLPGFMDIDTMVELSGTRSEYFPIIVADIAGTLDLYHGTDVYGISLLLALISENPTQLGALLSTPKEPGTARILAVYDKRCATNDWGDPDPKKDGVRVSRQLFYSFLRYLAWIAYKWEVADPSKDSETRALCKLLSDHQARSKLELLLRDLRWITGISREYSAQVVAGVRRALKKIDTMTSDVVDTILFDRLMDRLMKGFTIIHLAPPSTGNVDQLLGLVVKRLFYRHVGHYTPERLTVLVVEEAHNLAPAGEDKASKRALLRVAREGRKWGLSLWLVTQRPSFVASDLLSQTATSILLRTTNPEDLSTIKRSVESAAAEIVDRLPELEPSRGEALLTGLAAPERRIPLLILVEKLSRS
ncbi:MAG: DUF87 domain-containing protein [Desulfurococcales archaeon]|nr:DUF87 domain-containing protein [Desulfurococcales archaeon]